MGPAKEHAHVSVRLKTAGKLASDLQPSATPAVHSNPENALVRIFICVTLRWRVTKLTALRQARTNP